MENYMAKGAVLMLQEGTGLAARNDTKLRTAVQDLGSRSQAPGPPTLSKRAPARRAAPNASAEPQDERFTNQQDDPKL